MADKYFENIPNVFYNKILCKDITRRAILTFANTASPYAYYPYDIQSHIRSDQVAEYYYNQPALDWLVHLDNEIVDPYYGWYQTDEIFETAIIEKYGSVIEAQQKVKHYINNWADDDTTIDVSFYNNILEKSLRKYWQPIYGAGFNLLGYSRKQDDIVQNTNQIWQFEIAANNSDIGFTGGERVTISNTGAETVVGTGEIEISNSTFFRIKNISGNLIANSTVTRDIRGITSGANISSSNSQLWFSNISNTEFVYYTAVTFWDWEQEENEKRKSLALIGDNIEGPIVQEFERVMNLDTDPETGLSTG